LAEHFSFFDPVIQIDGTYDREYNAQQFTNYFKTLVTTGVLKGERNQLKLTATGTTMQTKVDTGVAYILGRYYENDSLKELTHDTESLGVSRIDRVVIRMDLNTEARYVKTFIKKGAPSQNPVPPTLTQTQTVYEISLAQVRVVGGQTFIAANAVTDERGTNVICPWASSNILPSFDDNALAEHINNQGIHVSPGQKLLIDNSVQQNKSMPNFRSFGMTPHYAMKVFPPVQWVDNGTISEYIDFAVGNVKPFSGVLRLTFHSIWNNSDASGGATVEFHFGIYGDEVKVSETKIISGSARFFDNFYIGNLFMYSGNIMIQIFKRRFNNSLHITAELFNAVGDARAILDGVGLNRYSLTSLINTTDYPIQKDYNARITENFTLVSNGKATVNQAVTDMGVYTAPDAPFATTAANIRNLSNIKAGTGTITSDNLRTTFAVSGLPFKPRAIMLQSRNANIQVKGMYNEQFTASEFLILINGNGMNNTFSVFQGGFNASAAYPNGTGLFDYWAIK